MNLFNDVDFTSADLRKTVYVAAGFTGCKFTNTKLDKVDFQSSNFTDCAFEGELREVIFCRKGFKGENFPENRMARIDLSRARLRWTEFRGLDLKDVYFPKDDEHIIVENFPEVLEKLLNFFKSMSDNGSKRLAAALKNRRKWLGTNQTVGIFNKADLVEIAGEEGLQSFMRIIGAG
ncbi:MAG: pentapeptide repeat-containing protein [Beijerinckiaceae bacterium]